MATATRDRLPSIDKKKYSSLPTLSSAKPKTSKATVTTEKPIDPLTKRLNHIRLHLLDNKKPSRITHQEPTLVFDKFLYLGGLKSLQDKNRLAHLNITHILSVVWIRPNKGSLPPNVKHMFIKADDSFVFDMTPYFEQACQFIEEARQSNGCVLVHCACGVSRSSTICCAYLIKHHSMSIEQALTELRSRRPIIQPNSGFLRQLIRFNEQNECDKANVEEVTNKLNDI